MACALQCLLIPSTGRTLPLHSRAGRSQQQQQLLQLALASHKSPRSSLKPSEENAISLFTDKEKEDPESVNRKSWDFNPSWGGGVPRPVYDTQQSLVLWPPSLAPNLPMMLKPPGSLLRAKRLPSTPRAETSFLLSRPAPTVSQSQTCSCQPTSTAHTSSQGTPGHPEWVQSPVLLTQT